MRLATSSFSPASGAMALVAALMGEPWVAVAFLALAWFGLGLRQRAGRLRG